MAATTLPHVSTLVLAAAALVIGDRACDSIQAPGVELREVECHVDQDCDAGATCIVGVCRVVAPPDCSERIAVDD